MSAGDIDVRCAFSMVCDQRWDQLGETEDPDRRHCGRCDRDVHRIEGVGQLDEARRKGLCIAVESPALPSAPQFEPPMMTLGMVSGPPPREDVPRAWLLGRSRLGPIAVIAAIAAVLALWWWL